jgi:(p)ppGpp synthase/HD superfamily hydrolase
VSPLFVDAVAYAADVHADQARKRPDGPGAGPAIPYLAHLLGVASLVLEAGGDEELAIAGLLHDAAEDHGGWQRLADIRRRFGDRVAQVVEDCSDSLEPEDAEKDAWEERKRAHLARLAHVGDDSLTVWAADKVHNGRAIVADLAVEGPTAMTRFHAAPDRVLWYYRENLALLQEREADPRLVMPLAAIVGDLGTLLGQAAD